MLLHTVSLVFAALSSLSDRRVRRSDSPSKKFQSQFEAVDSAIPFARYRLG